MKRKLGIATQNHFRKMVFLMLVTVACISLGKTAGAHEYEAATFSTANGQQALTEIYLPFVLKNYEPPVYLRTYIDDIWEFLKTCPQNDPAINTILNDFVIRKNGDVVSNISCSEPYTDMSVSEMTDALTYFQALRTIYYMNPEVPDHLPWTSMSLYDWMSSNIGGINIVDGVSGGYCCVTIDGKRYMVSSAATDVTLEWRKEWSGISSLIGFITHEVRHEDGGPGHVTGCATFPDGTVYGCDASYDLNNLGSYGVQYWLNNAWMTAYLHIGIGCASEDTARNTIQSHLSALNYTFRNRFVDPPPLLSMPSKPYGGPCYSP